AAKTRFRRLKLELVQSIGQMKPTHEFFIIFFNHQVVPMPARAPQLANRRNKQRYLEWATKIRADGDTDPRDAISFALRLHPDVIYFLTDGRFEPRAERALKKLSQQRVTIHTFAMGNREGEPILRQIAERNHGKFHFIP
ncbi:MAG: VWA domain-containing protein, partial [Planctomycetes bacterium]|nr:VWA domain-containing protein [Planctomycetota bacterium]